MRLFESPSVPGNFIVQVDGGEVHPRMTAPTYAGTFNGATGALNVWTPAGYAPRGWKDAARACLERALNDWRSGKLTVESRMLGER